MFGRPSCLGFHEKNPVNVQCISSVQPLSHQRGGPVSGSAPCERCAADGEEVWAGSAWS